MLSLDEERFLIPSMLPQERPDLQALLKPLLKPSSSNEGGDVDTASTENNNALQSLSRNYHMSYVPAGFWSRLIGEVLLFFTKEFMVINTRETLSRFNRSIFTYRVIFYSFHFCYDRKVDG